MVIDRQTFRGMTPIERNWRDWLTERSSLLRLVFVMIATQGFPWTLRVLLGLTGDWVDIVEASLVVLLTTPVLYAAVKNKSTRVNRTITILLLFISILETIAFCMRWGLHATLCWRELLVDLVSLGVVTGPALYFVVTDIMHRDFTENQLTYLAFHDILTGLPNREMYQQSLTKRIRVSKDTGQKLAVMFIDLDRFKNVNDTFGHGFGDQLLIEAAGRLKTGLRPGDRVSRQGGDEFTVLVENIPGTADAEKVARKIIHLLNQPFAVEGHELRVGCSIGIAMYPQDGEDAITLMKNADTAMYRAKEKGKNGYTFYTVEMNDTVIQKLVMEEWLNKALELSEFMLYYQPQVDVLTNRINGMEALLRWNHPRLGLISPAEFIPLAEETGLIIPIGEWVLRAACRQNKAWQLAGFPPLKMAVNISPIQFHQGNFVDVVLEVLNESGLDPIYLELEITEGIAMYHVDQVIQKLQKLCDLGVHISMDDFGTGYSSLTYLKQFPIHKLKIAQQFVRDITVDPDDAAIVQAIMAMAHSLKLKVIAEGVETEEQLSYLLDVHCQEIQGYIYSKPITSQEFTRMLEQTVA